MKLLLFFRWRWKSRMPWSTGGHCATRDPESSPCPLPPPILATAVSWKAVPQQSHRPCAGKRALTTGERLVWALAFRTLSGHPLFTASTFTSGTFHRLFHLFEFSGVFLCYICSIASVCPFLSSVQVLSCLPVLHLFHCIRLPIPFMSSIFACFFHLLFPPFLLWLIKYVICVLRFFLYLLISCSPSISSALQWWFLFLALVPVFSSSVCSTSSIKLFYLSIFFLLILFPSFLL